MRLSVLPYEDPEEEPPPASAEVADASVRLVPYTRMQRLLLLRASGQIAADAYSLTVLALFAKADEPLYRVDLGQQAIVLTREELHAMGGRLLLHLADGDELLLEPHTMEDDVAVIFPDDLARSRS